MPEQSKKLETITLAKTDIKKLIKLALKAVILDLMANFTDKNQIYLWVIHYHQY